MFPTNSSPLANFPRPLKYLLQPFLLKVESLNPAIHTRFQTSTRAISMDFLSNPVSNRFNRFTASRFLLRFHHLRFISGFHGFTVCSGFHCETFFSGFHILLRVSHHIQRLDIGFAPENKYPTALEDGMKALHWLAKQVNLAECSKSSGRMPESKKSDAQGQIKDAFGASLVEPWLAAHGDPLRCVLFGVSCGANIADYVACKSVEAGKLLDPIKVVAQVLMYPFFIGSTPTHAEIKLSNSYFFDMAVHTCMETVPPRGGVYSGPPCSQPTNSP